MKNTSAKILSTLMIATVLLGFAAVFPINAADEPTVFVDPASNVFSTADVGVGHIFNVNVTVANITELAGMSFTLSWNKSLLQCMPLTEILFHTVTPSAFWGNIWGLKLTFNNTAGTADYAQTWQDTAQAQADGYAPANITQAEYPIEGKLAACIIPFKILMVPTMTEGSLSCPLALSAVKAGNLTAGPIDVTTVNGTYTINYAPPTNFPWFSVEPPTYTASNVGEIFNISVKVNNLIPAWEAVGFEFKLSWNNTILQLLNVYEGPWLPPFGAPPNQGTLFMQSINPGWVQVGDVVLPDGGGVWHAPFPSSGNGSSAGTLAILRFNATKQGVFPTTLSCPLDLYGTKVANWLGANITQAAPVDGFYSIRPKVLGRRIDVFVCNYPDGYNGAGQNIPSDMFWPQKEVCLCANVTYNEWPEQQKDVAFEIFDPHQTRWGVIYARTNETGTARICFRLPWPCDDPEYYIGVWTVIGTVDIACTIVNDTLQFHYDYLVRVWKVTADTQTNSYKHNETMCFTVEYGSHAQALRSVILVVTAVDEVGVPFGFVYKNVTIGGTVFCQYKNFTDTVCIFVPKWTRAGEAEIDTAFLNDWPFLGGTVQSGYYLADAHNWVPPFFPHPYPGDQWLGYLPIFVNIEAAWA